MARTVEEAFGLFLVSIVPTETERQAATKHRATIEAKLEARFGLHKMFESGSFKHGTGVRSYSDVDLFASLKTARPRCLD
jgi:tRNA nucleotidyltransferase (CCA-adding enzyme)